MGPSRRREAFRASRRRTAKRLPDALRDAAHFNVPAGAKDLRKQLREWADELQCSADSTSDSEPEREWEAMRRREALRMEEERQQEAELAMKTAMKKAASKGMKKAAMKALMKGTKKPMKKATMKPKAAMKKKA